MTFEEWYKRIKRSISEMSCWDARIGCVPEVLNHPQTVKQFELYYAGGLTTIEAMTAFMKI